ncbi:hypothetical protein BRADI_4g34220v3 [Brachypodium distachyon]|uniref:K Homology domain-containing protein n=1 Tax=Brachypodium distachyon TaxID=15368 RepID=A0A2K2CS71_BRADI|nr:hypothetical protein BRADI_4g34220v3 [Brachypodium distachyon]
MEISPNPAAAGDSGVAPAAAAASASSANLSPPIKRPSTTLRLLCPSSRAAALRPARDLHVEHPPVGDEVVLVVSGPDAPAAAVRVWERVVGHRVGGDDAGEGEEEKEVTGVVGCRMLAAGGQVGCVLGKGGKTVERMRQESGAQIRVFRNKDQVPPCALQGDELIHISGSFSAARKALLLVSTCLQDNPRLETSNFSTGRSFGPPGSGVGCPPGVDSHSQRSYLPPHIPDYHARNFSSNVAAPGPRFFIEQEIVFRMICLNEMVGGIIGKGGATIRALQSDTGASVKVIDAVADSDERVIVISARENSEMMHSPAQDAVLRVYSRISEASMDKSSAVPARLLVPSQHIGCLLGKGGSIIAEMRNVTGASIRIFGNEQIPRCAQRNDELVQAQTADAPRSIPDKGLAMDSRKGSVAGENQVATPTSTTTEVVIPCKYIGFICGTNGSDLAEIQKISGAAITVHDPKPGDTDASVFVCGDPEQTKKAQSLIHAFIFCGLYQK